MKILSLLIASVILALISLSITLNYGYDTGYADASLFSDGLIDKLHAEVKETSILSEKQKCEELGGEFGIRSYLTGLTLYSDGRPSEPSKKVTEITCTTPAKELFNIKVK